VDPRTGLDTVAKRKAPRRESNPSRPARSLVTNPGSPILISTSYKETVAQWTAMFPSTEAKTLIRRQEPDSDQSMVALPRN